MVQQLLDRGIEVTAIVRSKERLPATVREHEELHVVEAAVLDLSDVDLREQVQGCDFVE